MITVQDYKDWLILRKTTKSEEGKLCYCGHTDKCSCGDPDFKTFQESVERGAIILGDPNNGWKSLDFPGKNVEILSSDINKQIISKIINDEKI